MTDPPKLDVTAANGVPFRVVLLRDGRSQNYHTLPHKPAVEFYDRRYPHTPDGQFTGARYNVDTLLGRDEYGTATGGLDLVGYEPSWKIDAATMGEVRRWLIRLLGPEPTPCPRCGKPLLTWREGQPDGDVVSAAMCPDEACGYEY